MMGTIMHINRPTNQSGGEGIIASPQLVEQELTVNIQAGEIKYIPIDVGLDVYEIRTVFVENDLDDSYIISIYDKKTDGNIVYKSLEETQTYDILNVPCRDKDSKKVVHAYIENKSSTPANFHIIIKVTSLI